MWAGHVIFILPLENNHKAGLSLSRALILCATLNHAVADKIKLYKTAALMGSVSGAGGFHYAK